MLLVALLGPSVAEPAGAAPVRNTIEISLAEALRALPATATTNDSVLPDGDSPSGDPPLLARCVECDAAPLRASETYAELGTAEPAERRPSANRARAPPAA